MAVSAATGIGMMGSACAMNPAKEASLACHVAGAENLPPETGGEGAVCAAIERAAATALQQAGLAPSSLSVSVNVTSPYLISAVASIDGAALPEQRVGITDRKLNQRAIDMLASAVAAQVSNSRK